MSAKTPFSMRAGKSVLKRIQDELGGIAAKFLRMPLTICHDNANELHKVTSLRKTKVGQRVCRRAPTRRAIG